MFKNLKIMLVALLLSLPTIGRAEDTDMDRGEIRGDMQEMGDTQELVACAAQSAEQTVESCEQMQPVNQENQETEQVLQETEQIVADQLNDQSDESTKEETKPNIWQSLKMRYVEGLATYALIEPVTSIIAVTHELGHAHMASIFFPGSVKNITFLPHVVKRSKPIMKKIGEREYPIAYQDAYGEYKIRYKNIYQTAKGSVSFDMAAIAQPNSDSSMEKFVYNSKCTLVCLAGPVAGAATGIALGKLSKHKKCPQWLRLPLRILSCYLPFAQLADNLFPDGVGNDGEQIFKVWGGKDDAVIARGIMRLSVVALSYAAGAYLLDKEFPQFFKELNEAFGD